MTDIPDTSYQFMMRQGKESSKNSPRKLLFPIHQTHNKSETPAKKRMAPLYLHVAGNRNNLAPQKTDIHYLFCISQLQRTPVCHSWINYSYFQESVMTLVLQISKPKSDLHRKATYRIPVLSFITNSEPSINDFFTLHCIHLINSFINICIFIDACA